MKETKVNFEVAGEHVQGVLFEPDAPTRGVGLVFAGPLTSVKEQVTGNYARAMAARGFTALTFDHRHFGESGGTPRQYESPPRKVEDLREAVSFLLDETGVEQVGAVGICAGAGYMARAVADDERIAAWGAVAGFFHDNAKQREWMGEGYEEALARAKEARRLFEETGEALTIPAVGDGEVAMPLAEAFEYYGTERGGVDNWVNAFALMSREETLPWDAQTAAPRIRVPSLVIHSDNALAPALARSFYEALGGEKQLVWTESKGQIDFYDDPTRIEPAADRLAEHFRKLDAL